VEVLAFSDSFLEELTARNDIADVVGEYVSLTKKSGSNQFGLCPFHSERTPSFSVSADKQMYYCFGCHKGGGVINFVMEIEGLTFPDAVHFLARRAGIAVPDEDAGYNEAVKRRERLLLANREAARFFFSTLATPLGETARNYINGRGISKEMVKAFGLGAAPEGSFALIDHLTKKGYSKEELLLAGLARRSNKGGAYDAFRGRLIFPVIDVRGNVLAFSGRRLDGENEMKYLNTSDTPLFSKSKHLYGLNLARKSRLDYFLLVEGNIDVISLHQAGFDNAVAPLGTALTADQSRLMHQYKKEVVIAFDADAAGERAAERAIGVLEKTGIRVKVLRIPGGKDPDDFIKTHGPDAFTALLDQRETHIEYRLLSLRGRYDLDLDNQRVEYLEAAGDLLAGLSSDVEVEVYGRRVADQTGVSLDSIKSMVKKRREQKKREGKRQMEKEGARPSRAAQPKARELRYDNAYSAMAEEGIIRLLLSDPTLYDAASALLPADFSVPFLGRAYEVICERIGAGKENTIATLTPLFTPEEMGRLTHLLSQPENMADAGQTLADYIKKIQTEKLARGPTDNLQEIYAKYKELKGVEKQDG